MRADLVFWLVLLGLGVVVAGVVVLVWMKLRRQAHSAPPPPLDPEQPDREA